MDSNSEIPQDRRLPEQEWAGSGMPSVTAHRGAKDTKLNLWKRKSFGNNIRTLYKSFPCLFLLVHSSDTM